MYKTNIWKIIIFISGSYDTPFDNNAESGMDEERKIKKLDDKSDDILDQLNQLGDYVFHIKIHKNKI